MTLRTKINDNLKEAMKAGNSAKVGVLRMVNAAIKQKDIDARTDTNKEPISDDAVLALLQNLIKSRRESVAMYEQGGRADLVAKEQAEIAVIEGFLPAQLSADEAAAMIKNIIAESGASSIKDMGKVMGMVKTKLAGQFDTAQASALVKQLLGG